VAAAPKPIAWTGKASWRLCPAWPDIVFRPVGSSVEMRYAIAYRRDQHFPSQLLVIL
jgi:hypothetical protein